MIAVISKNKRLKRNSEAVERVTGEQQWNDVIPLITVEIGWQMMQKHGVVVHKMIKNYWIWQWQWQWRSASLSDVLL